MSCNACNLFPLLMGLALCVSSGCWNSNIPDTVDSDDETNTTMDEDIWNERVAALEELLGKSSNTVLHSPEPFYLGGNADVIPFHQYVEEGVAYVTSDLTGQEDQAEGDLKNYELMICTRTPSDWAPNLISQLARYTLETSLNPGETMDIGSSLPEGSSISALLFTKPDLSKPTFHVSGRECAILLCIGITPEELEQCRNEGSTNTLQKLRNNGVFPFTDLERESVL